MLCAEPIGSIDMQMRQIVKKNGGGNLLPEDAVKIASAAYNESCQVKPSVKKEIVSDDDDSNGPEPRDGLTMEEESSKDVQLDISPKKTLTLPKELSRPALDINFPNPNAYD